MFSTDSLGDMKPTELHLRMQCLLGDSVVDETMLRNLFLLRLPVSIRTSLAAMQDKPLSQLVQIADTLVEISLHPWYGGQFVQMEDVASQNSAHYLQLSTYHMFILM